MNPPSEEKLLELARQEFGTLTEAEEKLFKAVAKGEVADYSAQKKEDNDPAGAENWGDDRVLKADRIAWLCTQPQPSALVTHHGILVTGVRVDGALDLLFTKVSFPLSFEGSAFAEQVMLSCAKLRGLSLPGTRTGPIAADGLKVEGPVMLCDGFRAEGEVSIVNASISGEFSCRDGQFINPDRKALNADGVNVAGGVFLQNGFKAKGEVRLLGASIGGNLECDKGQFINRCAGALKADGVTVAGSVFLRNGFKADGEVRLLSATIGRTLDCQDGQFINPDGHALNADGLTVTGSVFLRKGFKSEGEVSLLGATIGGDLCCQKSHFFNKKAKALSADRVRVTGSVFLPENFKAKGEVRLLSATIGGSLECDGGQFINPEGYALNADGLSVTGNVFLRDGFKAEGEVCLVGATIDGCLVWAGVDSPREATSDFRSAKIGTLWDEAASWPEKGRLFLDGLVYDGIDAHAPRDAESRIKWLNRQGDEQFLPQPYEQLATVLRKSGHEEDATEILIEKERAWARLTNMTISQRCWHWLYGWSLGYGYRLWQAYRIGVVILVTGIGIFSTAYLKGFMAPTKDDVYVLDDDGRPGKLKEDYPRFNALIYSLDVFVPLVDLHQCKYWLPKANHGREFLKLKWFSLHTGGLVRLYLWFHIIAGWIVATLLLAGLTGLVRR